MRAVLVHTLGVVAMLSSLSLGCGGSKDAIVIRSMPPGGSFTGVWFSPQYGEMHILQSGASAIGRYTKDERLGKIQGGIEGDIMRFEWSERREMIVGRPVQTRGHGYFRLVKDDAEDTWKLVGEWGNDANERGGGPWNAVKSKTRRPDVDGSGKSERDADEVSPSSGDEADDGPDDLSDL